MGSTHLTEIIVDGKANTVKMKTKEVVTEKLPENSETWLDLGESTLKIYAYGSKESSVNIAKDLVIVMSDNVRARIDSLTKIEETIKNGISNN